MTKTKKLLYTYSITEVGLGPLLANETLKIPEVLIIS